MLRVIQRLFGFSSAPTLIAPPGETTIVYVRVRAREDSANDASVHSVGTVSHCDAVGTDCHAKAIYPNRLQPRPPQTLLAIAAESAAASDSEELSIAACNPQSRKRLRTHTPQTLVERERGELESEPISRLRVFSRKWLAALHRAEIVTVGQLAHCDPSILAAKLPQIAGPVDGVSQSTAAMAFKIARVQRLIRFSSRFSDMTVAEANLLFAVHRRSKNRLSQDSVAMLCRDLQRFGLSSRGQKMTKRINVPDFRRVRSWIEQARQSVAACLPTQTAQTAPDTISLGS